MSSPCLPFSKSDHTRFVTWSGVINPSALRAPPLSKMGGGDFASDCTCRCTQVHQCRGVRFRRGLTMQRRILAILVGIAFAAVVALTASVDVAFGDATLSLFEDGVLVDRVTVPVQ
jgi:hypothetical protein